MKYVYAPGCALMAYKPHLADRLKQDIENVYGPVDTLLTCCFDRPALSDSELCIVTPCVTCAASYTQQYPESDIVFFLTHLAESTDFAFPDYGGMSMSIQDTCAARKQPQALQTIRRLLQRMNIKLVEPRRSGAQAKCCGQTLYGKTELERVEQFMQSRAQEMPCEDVVVYCASCIMSMTVGGKRPRYILDLLYGEPTTLPTSGVVAWNRALADFRHKHSPKIRIDSPMEKN